MFWSLFRYLAAILLLISASLPAQALKLSAKDVKPLDPSMELLGPATQEPQQKTRIISPEQAVRRAREQYPGKVLSVKLRGGGEFYAVKIIRQGRVRVVRVPAHY